MIRALFCMAIGGCLLALALTLSACGQKGPLKLPEAPQPAEPAK